MLSLSPQSPETSPSGRLAATMEKHIPGPCGGTLPLPSSSHASPRRVRYSRRLFALFVLALVLSQPWRWLSSSSHDGPRRLAKVRNPAEIDAIRTKCNFLHVPAGPPRSFWMRQVSDRYVEGTKPTLIRVSLLYCAFETTLMRLLYSERNDMDGCARRT